MYLKWILELFKHKTIVTIEDETHCGYYARKETVGSVLDNDKHWLTWKVKKVEFDKHYGFIIEIKTEKEN